MNDGILSEYLGYLKRMCGFSIRTLKRHERICTIWQDFLAEKNKKLLEAIPVDFLDFIELRHWQVNNATIAGELCVLRTLYAYLYDFEQISLNPAASIPELICEPPAEKSWLTVEECFQFLEAFDVSNPIGLRDYTITALLWSTGLRSGELCALNWRDIDLEDGALMVRKGKGGKQRQIFLNDRVRDDLLRYRRQMAGGAYDPVFYAFSKNASSKDKHARLSQSRLVEIIREHGKRAGIEKPVNPLTFRHCFSTHMYELGVGIADIKEMLGHDDETETTIYIHISIDAVKRFLKKHIANSN
jgi:site-specific recombinase XerD